MQNLMTLASAVAEISLGPRNFISVLHDPEYAQFRGDLSSIGYDLT